MDERSGGRKEESRGERELKNKGRESEVWRRERG